MSIISKTKILLQTQQLKIFKLPLTLTSSQGEILKTKRRMNISRSRKKSDQKKIRNVQKIRQSFESEDFSRFKLTFNLK